jgi:hypothetical protein
LSEGVGALLASLNSVDRATNEGESDDEASDEDEDNLDTGPRIPTVDLRLCTIANKRGWVFAQPNSRVPIPFETDLFKGHMILAVKTDPVDDRFDGFFIKNHTFEVQVQGKFKYMPAGEIYIGGQTTVKMELGIMTRTLCRSALGFVGTMVNLLSQLSILSSSD